MIKPANPQLFDNSPDEAVVVPSQEDMSHWVRAKDSFADQAEALWSRIPALPALVIVELRVHQCANRGHRGCRSARQPLELGDGGERPGRALLSSPLPKGAYSDEERLGLVAGGRAKAGLGGPFAWLGTA